MEIALETITPEKAKEWLSKNPENRPLRRWHVEAIARDMKAGRWQVNGDAIRFNCDGTLIDGQHRLTGCVKSGVSFDSLVIYGLSGAVRRTIDGGAKRTHGDRLAMRGVKSANIVSASLSVLYTVATGRLMPNLTSSELDDLLSLTPGIHDSVGVVTRAKPSGSASIPAAYHYIITRLVDRDLADEFLMSWAKMLPAFEGDPVQIFRVREATRVANGRPMARNEYLKTACRAIEAFIDREPLQKLIMKKEIGIRGWTLDRLMAGE